jgi:hypothetical protein
MNGDLQDSAYPHRLFQKLRITRRGARRRPAEAELVRRARQAIVQLPMLDREILLMWKVAGSARKWLTATASLCSAPVSIRS